MHSQKVSERKKTLLFLKQNDFWLSKQLPRNSFSSPSPSFCSNSGLFDTGARHSCKWPTFYCIDFTSHAATRLAQGQGASSHMPSMESGLMVVQKHGHIPGKIPGCWPLCSPPAQPRNFQLDNGPSQPRWDQETNWAWTHWEKSKISFNRFFKRIFLKLNFKH